MNMKINNEFMCKPSLKCHLPLLVPDLCKGRQEQKLLKHQQYSMQLIVEHLSKDNLKSALRLNIMLKEYIVDIFLHLGSWPATCEPESVEKKNGLQ